MLDDPSNPYCVGSYLAEDSIFSRDDIVRLAHASARTNRFPIRYAERWASDLIEGYDDHTRIPNGSRPVREVKTHLL